MKANVREATHEDISTLVEFSTQLSQEDGKQHGQAINHDWAQDHGSETFARSIDSSISNILVAEGEGKLVGSLHGYIQYTPSWRSTPIAIIISIYTNPDYRGQGVGSSLIFAFQSWATEQGATRLAVSAFASNHAAIRFYERHGFQPFELTLEKTLQ